MCEFICVAVWRRTRTRVPPFVYASVCSDDRPSGPLPVRPKDEELVFDVVFVVTRLRQANLCVPLVDDSVMFGAVAERRNLQPPVEQTSLSSVTLLSSTLRSRSDADRVSAAFHFCRSHNVS